MKTYKNNFRLFMVSAMILFAHLTNVSAGWTRYDLPAGAGSTYSNISCADETWNIFWFQRGSNLWGAWNTGSGWNAASYASNLDSGNYNCMASDSSRHIVWYNGNDGYIWALYYNGSAWVTAKVGTNQNDARQFCVDSNLSILWYVASDGKLWAIYWNGSSWVETMIDATPRSLDSGAKISGCDSNKHWVWTVSADKKNLLVTYLNGGVWTTGTIVTLPAGEKFGSVCPNSSDNHCYQLIKDNATNAALRVQESKLQGVSWATGSFWTESLPTTSSNQHLFPPHNQQYMCYLSNGLITGAGNATHPIPRFSSFSYGARSWSSGWTHGRGILMGVCNSGRAMLCQDVDVNTTNTNGGMFVLWNTDF